MNGVLGHFYALSRLNWARDNLGHVREVVSLMEGEWSFCRGGH